MILNNIEISEEELMAQLAEQGYEVKKEIKSIWLKADRLASGGLRFNDCEEIPDTLIQAYEKLYEAVKIGWDKNGDLDSHRFDINAFGDFSRSYMKIRDIKSRMAKT